MQKVGTENGENVGEKMGNGEKSGMWADTKHPSDPTAQQSLQAIARLMEAETLNKNTGVRAFSVALFGKLKSTERILALIINKLSLTSFKTWLWSLSEFALPKTFQQNTLTSSAAPAGRAAKRSARIEQDWEDAVKRARATHALHEHMVCESQPMSCARLTLPQNELQAARARHDQTTGSAVSSALGHRQPTRPRRATREAVSPPAGSIWSNEQVWFLAPAELPASEVLTPGLRQLKPTPPHPAEISHPHSIFQDPAHAKLDGVNDWKPRDSLSNADKEYFDPEYFPKPEWLEDCDKYQEIHNSYMECVASLPKMGRSSLSLDLVDQLIQGDGNDKISFGRWTYYKSTSLSVLRDMIERELRGPGSCSLYGPGGLKVSDHPLVRYYNERVQQEENENLQASTEPALSPILMQGNSASQRLSMRSTTPVTFNMNEEGTFQTTGFHTRTGSMGSTVESSPFTESSEIDTQDIQDAQEEALRDSGIHGLPSVESSQKASNAAGQASLGNYEVLRRFTLDPAMEESSKETFQPYSRRQPAWATESYVNNFCGGVNEFGIMIAPAKTPDLATQDDAQVGASDQQEQPSQRNRNVSGGYAMRREGRSQRRPYRSQPHAQQIRNDGREHEATLEHRAQTPNLEHPEQQAQLDETTGNEHNAHPIPLTQSKHIQFSENQSTPATTKQSKHVSFDESKNISFKIPAREDRRVILVAPEDAEDAMMSDDEDTVVGIEAPEARKKTPYQPASLSSHGMPNKPTLDTASENTAPKIIRPILKKRSSSNAADSNSSSVASATAGLNTSAEPTPIHATPGTTASSGDDRQIKSPARAEFIGRKLAQHLKHAYVSDPQDEDYFEDELSTEDN